MNTIEKHSEIISLPSGNAAAPANPGEIGRVGNTICCHNGDVYRLEKLKPNNDIAVLEEKAYTYCKEKYADYDDEKIEYECSSRMIKVLLRRGYLKFTKR